MKLSLKKIEVIVRTTEDNLPPCETVLLKFVENGTASTEPRVLSYPGLEIHLEHHRVFKDGVEVYMSRYEYDYYIQPTSPKATYFKKGRFDDESECA